MTIEILESARRDLADGRRFYERQGELWLGSYFFDTLFAAIDTLRFYGGIHPRHYGFYRMLVPHFPYSVYYDLTGEVVQVYAVVDNRRDPEWISGHLSSIDAVGS